MPPLIRLFVVNTALGCAASAAFVAMLFAFNVANLWGLVSNSDVGLLAGFLLWFFHATVFSAVQIGIAMMRLADPDDLPRGPRPNLPELAKIPVISRPRG